VNGSGTGAIWQAAEKDASVTAQKGASLMAQGIQRHHHYTRWDPHGFPLIQFGTIGKFRHQDQVIPIFGFDGSFHFPESHLKTRPIQGLGVAKPLRY
jgi:hypothetical protein